ncbi:hypothetical protein SeMB42_g02789 [Synchytrium endobioticum]|uniref:Uncharacterized protein n=1 Tax=Synchytrium endobioticum TaxID=286115 RepID=A0A507DC19_9FUNG|nr:hypothetical protein SeMB42_g02789 [Synchytrium endobioticum]
MLSCDNAPVTPATLLNMVNTKNIKTVAILAIMILLTSAPVGRGDDDDDLIHKLTNRKGSVYRQKYTFGEFESLICMVLRGVNPDSLDPPNAGMESLQIRVARAYHASVFEKLKSLYMYVKLAVSRDIFYEEGKEALMDGRERVGGLMRDHYSLAKQYCALRTNRGQAVKFSKLPPELDPNSEEDSDSRLPEMIEFLRLCTNRISALVGRGNEAEVLIFKLNTRKNHVYNNKYVLVKYAKLICRVLRGVNPDSLDEFLEGSGFTSAQLSQPPDVKTMNTLQIRVARAYHASVYEKLRSLYMYLKPSVRGDIPSEKEQYLALPTRGQVVKFSQLPEELRQRQDTNREWRSDIPPPTTIDVPGQDTNREWRGDTSPPEMIDFLGRDTNPEWRSDTPPPTATPFFGNADEQALRSLDLSLGGNTLEGYKQTTLHREGPSVELSSIPQYAFESSSYIHNDRSKGKRPMHADDPTCFHFSQNAHGGLDSGSEGSTYPRGGNSKASKLL